MSSNNSKYSQEMRDRTARHVIESGKSASSVGEELGIDKNTICRWIRDYRRKHNLPSYAEEKGYKKKDPKSNSKLIYEVKELEKEIKKKNKLLEEERKKVEILKKSLHIFMQPQG